MNSEPNLTAVTRRDPSQRLGFHEALETGEFVVTAELMPPKGPDVESFKEKIDVLSGRVNAINVTDCSRAVLRMSSMAASVIIQQRGVDAVYQLTCRDRNILALQSDLLGAAALNVRSVLALTGDGIRHGDHPDAKPVFEVESIGLLDIIRKLNRGKNSAGGTLNAPARILAGAVVNPNFLPGRSHRKRFLKKVEAGARFFQTQMLTNMEAFESFMEYARPLGATVLGGILVIKSLKNAQFLNEMVPGIRIEEEILKRFEANDSLDTGLDIAAEQVARCRELCGGVHIMSLGKEQLVLDVLDRAGL
ncbi:MAG: hypothetical protein AUK47_28825 [Deltaproteobacteria bacterium CG2_30_63_29]|nr:MAG: hypothetical protein AUK47_28825 [Deltaproteobacteria bacterium CG2_30_63_29]PJB35421.1 MAG: 5,10-methylenetetrahydrofolate reductase [Deltaproteobacteria bacterium CG_4_9_14_3_um_filter_63_12]